MAQPVPLQPVTEDALIQHRLKELEAFATGGREMERRVDGLALTTAAIEKTVTEIQAEARLRDDRTSGSLARLHARLDEITTAESFEKGRVAGTSAASSKTWKVVAYSVTTTIAFGLLIVAALNFALN